MRIGNTLLTLVCIAFFLAGCRTVTPPTAFLPEPPPTPLVQRETPCGMTWFDLVDDEARTRNMLTTLRDMGVRKPLALIYWWRWDTKGWEYASRNYKTEHVDEAYRRAIDYYVNIALELGLQPCFRVGSFTCFKGLYHPADPNGSVELYADWLREIAARYRGKVYLWLLGDEENRPFPDFGWSGTPEDYMERFFKPSARGVRKGDPDTLIGIGSVSSAPATPWILKVIELGLPDVADGVSGNFWYHVIGNRIEMENLVQRVRALWPECRFFGHMGYVENRDGLHDARQAQLVAQCMFTCWNMGWDTIAYYLYRFSTTADTRLNYGLLKSFGEDGNPPKVSDGWKAMQTMAHTFYNRSKLKDATARVRLRQAEKIESSDGFSFTLAPPDPEMHAFIRDDRQLLIYLACPELNDPSDGCWDVVISGVQWGNPQRIPLLDYMIRRPLPHRWEDGNLIIEKVRAGREPAIITLQRAVTAP